MPPHALCWPKASGEVLHLTTPPGQRVQGTGRCTCMTSTGQELEVASDSIEMREVLPDDGVDDLTKLSYLHEPAILDNLLVRAKPFSSIAFCRRVGAPIGMVFGMCLAAGWAAFGCSRTAFLFGLLPPGLFSSDLRFGLPWRRSAFSLAAAVWAAAVRRSMKLAFVSARRSGSMRRKARAGPGSRSTRTAVTSASRSTRSSGCMSCTPLRSSNGSEAACLSR